MEKNGAAGKGAAQGAAAPRWDSTAMRSAYCNLATATATADSVVVNLGVRQGAAEAAELKAELLHRILLAPRTAKELHQILGRLLVEHEARRGG
jgi:hypothetical protein